MNGLKQQQQGRLLLLPMNGPASPRLLLLACLAAFVVGGWSFTVGSPGWPRAPALGFGFGSGFGSGSGSGSFAGGGGGGGGGWAAAGYAASYAPSHAKPWRRRLSTVRMGVPGGTVWLRRTFPGAFTEVARDEQANQPPFDHIYVDVNDILHTVGVGDSHGVQWPWEHPS